MPRFKRPENSCSHCGHTWRPRGSDRSERCPKCRKANTVQAVDGRGVGTTPLAVVIPFVALWGMGIASGFILLPTEQPLVAWVFYILCPGLPGAILGLAVGIVFLTRQSREFWPSEGERPSRAVPTSPRLTDAVFGASEEVWRQVTSLSEPLLALIAKAAAANGLEPADLVQLIQAEESWPSLEADQVQALQLVRMILEETAEGPGPVGSRPVEMADDGRGDRAMRMLGSNMEFFKGFLAEAYAVGVSSQIDQAQAWSRSKGEAGDSAEDAQLLLHGLIQGELRSGSRFVHKPELIAKVLEVLACGAYNPVF